MRTVEFGGNLSSTFVRFPALIAVILLLALFPATSHGQASPANLPDHERQLLEKIDRLERRVPNWRHGQEYHPAQRSQTQHPQRKSTQSRMQATPWQQLLPQAPPLLLRQAKQKLFSPSPTSPG